MSCYLRPDRFEAIPAQPILLHHGCEAFLVSYKHGVLQDIPGIDTIRDMPSFRRLEMMTQPGASIKPTVDCFTRPGSVQMVNESAEALKKDYDAVRSLELDGLFELQD